MMGFDAEELLALSPADLRFLLDAADGDSVMERAAHIGLKPLTHVSHYEALSAAVPELVDRGQPFCPPIGAGQPGVSLDLTPPGTAPEPLPDGIDVVDALSQSTPEAVADLADALQKSADSGEPFIAGTFALYGHPSGAIIAVTETTTLGLQKSVFPRKLVRVALSMMAGGGKRGLLSRLLRG